MEVEHASSQIPESIAVVNRGRLDVAPSWSGGARDLIRLGCPARACQATRRCLLGSASLMRRHREERPFGDGVAAQREGKMHAHGVIRLLMAGRFLHGGRVGSRLPASSSDPAPYGYRYGLGRRGKVVKSNIQKFGKVYAFGTFAFAEIKCSGVLPHIFLRLPLRLDTFLSYANTKTACTL